MFFYLLNLLEWLNLLFNLFKRNIITEIIQTEKSYVQDLGACLDVIIFSIYFLLG